MTPIRSCEVYIDGASRGNPGPSGVGVVLATDGGARPVGTLSKYVGETTNNVAEYLALLYALQEALRRGYTAVTVRTDSELLERQIIGRYQVRDRQLRILHGLALHLAGGFQRFTIAHIPRTDNRLADRLAGQAVRERQ